MKTLAEILSKNQGDFETVHRKSKDLAESVGVVLRMNRSSIFETRGYLESEIFIPACNQLRHSLLNRSNKATEDALSIQTLLDTYLEPSIENGAIDHCSAVFNIEKQEMSA